MKSPYSGMKRVIYAAGYSWKGFVASWKFEAAFRQELILVGLLSPFAFLIGDTGFEIGILLATLILILIVELLNSAVESIVDRVGEEYHSLSGRAKDQGSAAVFLAFLFMLMVWGGLIFDKWIA